MAGAVSAATAGAELANNVVKVGAGVAAAFALKKVYDRLFGDRKVKAGESCYSDENCPEDHICRGAGVTGFSVGTCIPRKADDSFDKKTQSCSIDNQCINGACGRPEAGADNLICCPTGATHRYAGYDYCSQLPVGKKCFSNDMCASGKCKGNWYGIARGVCEA